MSIIVNLYEEDYYRSGKYGVRKDGRLLMRWFSLLMT